MPQETSTITPEGSDDILNQLDAEIGDLGGEGAVDTSLPPTEPDTGYTYDTQGALFLDGLPVLDGGGQSLSVRDGRVYDAQGREFNLKTMQPVQGAPISSPAPELNRSAALRPEAPWEQEWNGIEGRRRVIYERQGFDDASVQEMLALDRDQYMAITRQSRAASATSEALSATGVNIGTLDPRRRAAIEKNMRLLLPDIQGTPESAVIAAAMDVVDRMKSGESVAALARELGNLFDPQPVRQSQVIGMLPTGGGARMTSSTERRTQAPSSALASALGVAAMEDIDAADAEIFEMRKR